MVLSNFRYSVKECAHHFVRSWTSVLGAVVSIFLSLFIIGLFMIGTVLINNVVGTVEDSVTIEIYLSDDAEQLLINNYQKKVESWEEVLSVTYKSKEEALEDYKASNSNAEDVLASLDGVNPLPASLIIKLEEPQQVEACAQKIIEDQEFAAICDTENNPSEDVSYGQEIVQKLFSLTNYLRFGMAVLVALLTFVAFVFINNTIRLAITSRSREIAIMRLVGASNSFIRGPFIMEGVVEALLGALFAIIALAVGTSKLLPLLSESISFLSFDISKHVLMYTYLIILGIGFVIGWLGSFIAMRRYLKV